MIRQSVSALAKIIGYFNDNRALLKPKPQCGHRPVIYATSSLSLYEGRMIVRTSPHQFFRCAGLASALLVLGIGLSGCADMSDSMTTAFADPAKYDLYDCKQLEAERKSLAARAAELQGLMAKADTGVAGPVVAELAYRNEYLSVRGQSRFAEQAWERNKCSPSAPAADAAAVKPAQSVNTKGRRPSMSPGSTVH